MSVANVLLAVLVLVVLYGVVVVTRKGAYMKRRSRR
jgi:hypothetical protein